MVVVESEHLRTQVRNRIAGGEVVVLARLGAPFCNVYFFVEVNSTITQRHECPQWRADSYNLEIPRISVLNVQNEEEIAFFCTPSYAVAVFCMLSQMKNTTILVSPASSKQGTCSALRRGSSRLEPRDAADLIPPCHAWSRAGPHPAHAVFLGSSSAPQFWAFWAFLSRIFF